MVKKMYPQKNVDFKSLKEKRYLLQKNTEMYATSLFNDIFKNDITNLAEHIKENGFFVEAGYVDPKKWNELMELANIHPDFVPFEVVLKKSGDKYYISFRRDNDGYMDYLESEINAALFSLYWGSAKNNRIKKYRLIFLKDEEKNIILEYVPSVSMVIARIYYKNPQAMLERCQLGVDISNSLELSDFALAQ